MASLPLTVDIPAHLVPFITQQDPSLYTPIDQACWRFTLKISQDFFKTAAHEKYLNGLQKTGISTERIPLIEEIDACLRTFHWRAVSVSGFIPPAVFMEFLSLGILPIACDMRTLEHLAYTPAPDIIHEAAGHAPILSDAEYASYLRCFGEISIKAITSNEDLSVYQAIRTLSDSKENPLSTDQEIRAAQEALDQALAAVTYTSEATLLSRMGWWTFEYGLFGSLSNPKIYGAGLLSSLAESYHCMDSKVKKIPFSIDCIKTSYDITRPQPQLFVTPNFQSLKTELMELASRMSFRTGGKIGLQRAIQSKTVTTTVLETGLQISGILSAFQENTHGEPCYLQFVGPTQLSFQNQEILEHGITHHPHGFGTPLDTIRESDLELWNVMEGNFSRFQLDSGIVIEGELIRRLVKNEIILLSFSQCTVKSGDRILFQPEWGVYDMACGKKVVSVFSGPADRNKYPSGLHTPPAQPTRPKTTLTQENSPLTKLYQAVRTIRENRVCNEAIERQLDEIHQKLEQTYPADWLLRLEMLELQTQFQIKADWALSIHARLDDISKRSKETRELIQRGLALFTA